MLVHQLLNLPLDSGHLVKFPRAFGVLLNDLHRAGGWMVNTPHFMILPKIEQSLTVIIIKTEYFDLCIIWKSLSLQTFTS